MQGSPAGGAAGAARPETCDDDLAGDDDDVEGVGQREAGGGELVAAQADVGAETRHGVRPGADELRRVLRARYPDPAQPGRERLSR